MISRHIAKANRLFADRYHGQGNFMTPDIIARGMTKSGRFAWELSQGEGINRQPIYGVTVLDAATRESEHSLCCLFQSRLLANDHIDELP
jgi:hypothetical protein